MADVNLADSHMACHVGKFNRHPNKFIMCPIIPLQGHLLCQHHEVGYCAPLGRQHRNFLGQRDFPLAAATHGAAAPTTAKSSCWAGDKMCVELLGGTFHSPNCSLAISQASTHSFLSFCHPDWNRVSGLRAKYIPCGECRQQTPLRGGSSCLVAPLGLSMALQESGLRWKIRQLRGRAVPGPGVWFLQGKCAALLGWDPSSTWDTPPASEALGGGEWHHQN